MMVLLIKHILGFWLTRKDENCMLSLLFVFPVLAAVSSTNLSPPLFCPPGPGHALECTGGQSQRPRGGRPLLQRWSGEAVRWPPWDRPRQLRSRLLCEWSHLKFVWSDVSHLQIITRFDCFSLMFMFYKSLYNQWQRGELDINMKMTVSSGGRSLLAVSLPHSWPIAVWSGCERQIDGFRKLPEIIGGFWGFSSIWQAVLIKTEHFIILYILYFSFILP